MRLLGIGQAIRSRRRLGRGGLEPFDDFFDADVNVQKNVDIGGLTQDHYFFRTLSTGLDATEFAQGQNLNIFAPDFLTCCDLIQEFSLHGPGIGFGRGDAFDLRPGRVGDNEILIAFDLFRVTATVLPELAAIDIKPGSDTNSIKLRSKGMIPVAVLTTETFDAIQVDWETVVFGPDGATESHGSSHVNDVDGDGDMDLVFHFNTQNTGIGCGDTSATLIGVTFSGDVIEVTDSINTVGC